MAGHGAVPMPTTHAAVGARAPGCARDARKAVVARAPSGAVAARIALPVAAAGGCGPARAHRAAVCTPVPPGTGAAGGARPKPLVWGRRALARAAPVHAIAAGAMAAAWARRPAGALHEAAGGVVPALALCAAALRRPEPAAGEAVARAVARAVEPLGARPVAPAGAAAAAGALARAVRPVVVRGADRAEVPSPEPRRRTAVADAAAGGAAGAVAAADPPPVVLRAHEGAGGAEVRVAAGVARAPRPVPGAGVLAHAGAADGVAAAVAGAGGAVGAGRAPEVAARAREPGGARAVPGAGVAGAVARARAVGAARALRAAVRPGPAERAQAAPPHRRPGDADAAAVRPEVAGGADVADPAPPPAPLRRPGAAPALPGALAHAVAAARAPPGVAGARRRAVGAPVARRAEALRGGVAHAVGTAGLGRGAGAGGAAGLPPRGGTPPGPAVARAVGGVALAVPAARDPRLAALAAHGAPQADPARRAPALPRPVGPVGARAVPAARAHPVALRPVAALEAPVGLAVCLRALARVAAGAVEARARALGSADAAGAARAALGVAGARDVAGADASEALGAGTAERPRPVPKRRAGSAAARGGPSVAEDADPMAPTDGPGGFPGAGHVACSPHEIGRARARGTTGPRPHAVPVAGAGPATGSGARGGAVWAHEAPGAMLARLPVPVALGGVSGAVTPALPRGRARHACPVPRARQQSAVGGAATVARAAREGARALAVGSARGPVARGAAHAVVATCDAGAGAQGVGGGAWERAVAPHPPVPAAPAVRARPVTPCRVRVARALSGPGHAAVAQAVPSAGDRGPGARQRTAGAVVGGLADAAVGALPEAGLGRAGRLEGDGEHRPRARGHAVQAEPHVHAQNVPEAAPDGAVALEVRGVVDGDPGAVEGPEGHGDRAVAEGAGDRERRVGARAVREAVRVRLRAAAVDRRDRVHARRLREEQRARQRVAQAERHRDFEAGPLPGKRGGQRAGVGGGAGQEGVLLPGHVRHGRAPPLRRAAWEPQRNLGPGGPKMGPGDREGGGRRAAVKSAWGCRVPTSGHPQHAGEGLDGEGGQMRCVAGERGRRGRSGGGGQPCAFGAPAVGRLRRDRVAGGTARVRRGWGRSLWNPRLPGPGGGGALEEGGGGGGGGGIGRGGGGGGGRRMATVSLAANATLHGICDRQ